MFDDKIKNENVNMRFDVKYYIVLCCYYLNIEMFYIKLIVFFLFYKMVLYFEERY